MQIALGVVGGIIGGFFGGPAGAEAGFMVGSLIGGLLDPPKQPQLPDLKIQTSAYGRYIPSIWGRFRVAGNVVWAGTVTQQTMSKKKAPVEAAFIPMAVGLCQGPIQSVTRIWANSTLIYDITDPGNFQNLTGSAQQLSGFTVYPGDENQGPDPTMESFLGVGNVPSFRGLAYVVFSNLELLSYGNVVPQLEFEVVTTSALAWAAGTLSTWSYPSPDVTIMSAPCLTANGAIAVGYAYFTFYDGLYIGNLNAYSGSTTEVIPSSEIPVPPGDCGAGAGNSDVPGIVTSHGWYGDDGEYIAWPGMSSVVIGGCWENTVYCRNGAGFYVSTTFGGTPEYIYAISTITGALIATSDVLGLWTVLGVSDDFLYALGHPGGAGTTAVYQFNRASLVHTGVVYPAPGASTGIGWVTDDNTIWLTAGGFLYRYNVFENVWTTLGPAPFAATSMTVVNEEFVMFANTGTANQVTIGYSAAGGLGQPANLSDIVTDICLGTGLTSGQFDVTSLTDQVVGYCVTTYASGRSALDQLMSLYFFDAVDSEGKIKFIKRGGASVVTIPWADIGVKASGGASAEDPIQETVADATELPRSLILSYKGSSNDYQLASQRGFRSTTESNYDATASVNVVLADGEAATRAQSLLWTAWQNRRSMVFGTTTAYLEYEPTDVVTLTDVDGTLYTLRLSKCDYDGKGSLSWTAAIESQTYPNLAAFTASGGQSIGVPKQTIPYSGPSVLAIVDTPPLRPTDTNPGLYLAACGYASSWPGITVEMSRDDSTFTSVDNMNNDATIGVTTSVLAAFTGGNQPDELSTVIVELYNGSLSTVSYATFLSGTNLALIGNELVAFRVATQLTANTYQLNGFLRGVSGTGNQGGSHFNGERFVFLDPSTLFYESIFQTDVGRTLYYEYQLANMFYAQPTPGAQDLVTNACVKPLNPVLFTALHGSASSVNDITLNWLRCARVNAGWNDGTDVPLDESTESYQLQVLNGSNVLVRTIVVLGPFVATGAEPFLPQGNPTTIYTAAMITADGFTTGNTINFSVAQNSDQGVLGWPAVTSITR